MKNGKTDFTREYLQKYIELHKKNKHGFSKNFIAKILYAEHPDIYTSKEDARYYIGGALKTRGNSGSYEKSEELLKQWAFIAEPIQEIDFEPYVLPKGYNKPLFIADLHGILHDRQAVEVAINHGIKEKCDCVVILGDFLDNYQWSTFPKSTLIAERFWEEREWGIDILQLLQNIFGLVICKLGNHDGRREKAIEQLPAKFSDLIELSSYSDYLRFDGSNVQFVQPHNIVKVGKLNCIHGDEIYGGGGVHVAYNRLNKAFDNILSAHSHIISQTPPRATISGEVFGSWTIGCLCNLHPKYNPINQWRHGFAIVDVEDDGMFIVHNLHIINGRIF
jgi:predicted phosphodiesterase